MKNFTRFFLRILLFNNLGTYLFSEILQFILIFTLIHVELSSRFKGFKTSIFQINGSIVGYDTEAFRCPYDSIKRYLNGVLNDPSKRGDIPWWIEITLKHWLDL